ncbi:acyltransferase [Mucilaginibacter pallidiroseus]|uniref:Acyltransferase n=1 Tax=Mucilaginibacter pallidiroseus TaxID=2599295 RepID=A0A563UJC0_9SPHI|nr:acyltransferase [Mucilaginibacter pallidiroseus]TWR31462.1 acyltransferase [Mucilaginibacter pallidiroseus]
MSETPTEVNHKKSYLYFANLDGIRAIAALMVVISHIEYHKVDYGFQRFEFLNLSHFGGIGVTIFFSLSGFLITYLLLEEKKKFNGIGMRDFYTRRILRIWPLYFLVVLTGFFIYPAQGSTTGFLMSVFFVPSLAFCMHMLPSIFDPIWSIGTEEQFYIFHPHIFKIKKRENILKVLIIICLSIIVFATIIHSMPVRSKGFEAFNKVLYYARFDNMMIGAIVALLYYNTKWPEFTFRYQKLFNALFNKYMQWLIILGIIMITLLDVTHGIPRADLPLSILSALLIANLCESQTSVLSFKGSGLKFIGKISYGIYLLHKYPLFLTFYLVKRYLPDAGPVSQNLIFYFGSMVLIIALATVSYYGYERYFLRLKTRFQKISQSKAATV